MSLASSSNGAASGSSRSGLWGKMKKASSDISARTLVGSKNTKETISIQKKQHLILDCKKSFGVEYLDLLEYGASPQELEACVQRALVELAVLRDKVAKYKERIAANEAELENRLSSSRNNNNNSPPPYASVSARPESGINPFEEAAAAPNLYWPPSSPHSDRGGNRSSRNPFDFDDDGGAAEVPPVVHASVASSYPGADLSVAHARAFASAPPHLGTNPLGDSRIGSTSSRNPFDDNDGIPLATNPSASASATSHHLGTHNPFDDSVPPAMAPPSTNPFDDDDASVESIPVVPVELIGPAYGSPATARVARI